MTHQVSQPTPTDWPDLPFSKWADTRATLHLWTQVVGKIRLAHAPMVNHWWQTPLYITCRGLTTSPIPYGGATFQIDFDFIHHALEVQTDKGEIETVALGPRSVADFYAELMGRLRGLGLETRIRTMPVEIPDGIPFERDHEHASYDAGYANRFWRSLVQAARVLTVFRSTFLGKVSPVHFFWGSFDLAVTRFSGRTAPRLTSNSPNVGAWVMQEAYSHEVSSAGFWPGDPSFRQAAFYSYAYPEPKDFAGTCLRGSAAFYDQGLGQYILPYDAVREAKSPDADLLAFLEDTYSAAADLGHWDRETLERAPHDDR